MNIKKPNKAPIIPAIAGVISEDKCMATIPKNAAMASVTDVASPSRPSVKLAPLTVPRTAKYKSTIASQLISTNAPVTGILSSKDISENFTI